MVRLQDEPCSWGSRNAGSSTHTYSCLRLFCRGKGHSYSMVLSSSRKTPFIERYFTLSKNSFLTDGLGTRRIYLPWEQWPVFYSICETSTVFLKTDLFLPRVLLSSETCFPHYYHGTVVPDVLLCACWFNQLDHSYFASKTVDLKCKTLKR